MSALPAIREVPRINRMSVPYVQVPSGVLRDKRLSANARCLYALLLDYNAMGDCRPGRDRLADDLGVSVETVDRAINELVKAKLVTKKRRGRGNTNLYFLNFESSPMKSQQVDESSPMRLVESSPMRHKQEQIEQEDTYPPKPPKEKHLPDGFPEFYAAYPNKKARQNAERAWTKLNPTPDLQRTIMAALEIQKRSSDWTKEHGRYVPHPATWLNGRRWEDEVSSQVQSGRNSLGLPERFA